MPSDHADALAAKRKKLEELKKKREERKAAKEAQNRERAEKQEALAQLVAENTERRASVFDNPENVLDSVTALIGEVKEDEEEAKKQQTQLLREIPELSISNILSEHELMPAIRVQYEKGVQVGGEHDSEIIEEGEDEESLEARHKQLEEQQALQKVAIEEETKRIAERKEEERKAKELNAAQKASIIASSTFQEFFGRSSVLIERALNQNEAYDVAVDYAHTGEDDEQSKSSQLRNKLMFYSKDQCRNRPITSIDWSPQFKELMLCAYSHKEDSLSLEPDGLVLVWSTALPQRPEYKFYTQSAVLSAQWHPSNPKLIIASTESGQVVVWDTREKSTPVDRTSLTNGHTHPVYALSSIPSGNVHNIISTSTDGTLRIWNDNDLVEPTAQLDLRYGEVHGTNSRTKKKVPVNCIGLPSRDTNTAILGSDDGKIYKSRLYDNAGVYECINAHDAMITNIQFHPNYKNEPREILDLYLTSSYDWTCKLWSTRTSQPLFTFENARDYVYDVQWSPTKPSLFALGDGNGTLEFWDLNKDTEIPVHSEKVLIPEDKNAPQRAISQIKWSEDGKKIAVGSSSGGLFVYDVSNELIQNEEDDQAKFYEVMKRATLSSV